MLPEFKRPDSAVRRPAILAIIQGAAVIEKREQPAVDLNSHETGVNLFPSLPRGPMHGARAEGDVLQHLVDLASGESRFCVQIFSVDLVSDPRLQFSFRNLKSASLGFQLFASHSNAFMKSRIDEAAGTKRSGMRDIHLPWGSAFSSEQTTSVSKLKYAMCE